MDQFFEFFRNLFNPEGFNARWNCGEWTEFHGWLYILSNIAVWAAYFAIPLFLFYFIRKKKDVPFQRIFWLFIFFILLCGATHLIDALIFWYPIYRFNGLLLFCTAVISWFTLYSFYKALPEILTLKTPAQLVSIIKSKTSELEVTNYRLGKKNKQLEDFAYIVSHNIRSPLNNMSALISLYSMESSAEEKESLVRRMGEVLTHFTETVSDLTEVVNINQEADIKHEVLEFEKIINHLLISLSTQISSSNAKIEYDFSSCPKVDYPKTYLESILLNLLTNAIKYRSKERNLVIRLKSYMADDKLFLTCEDNGLGIDLNMYGSKIFGMGKKFHDNPDSRGIGLYITKTQLESFGGEISVESELNKGTKFTVRFN